MDMNTNSTVSFLTTTQSIRVVLVLLTSHLGPVLRNTAVTQRTRHPEVEALSILRLVEPLYDRLDNWNKSLPADEQPGRKSAQSSAEIPDTFVDAMFVREEVFVAEQKVPLENEFDEDDARCFHWVAYTRTTINEDEDATVSTRTRRPVGTIRLVPLVNTLHTDHLDHHRRTDGSLFKGTVQSSIYNGTEPFIKLGRLAVVQQSRGQGLANVLLRAALTYAKANPGELLPQTKAVTSKRFDDTRWCGLVLVHAQTSVQKFYERWGFKVDEGMGIWDEEGIDHIAMWLRLEI